MDELRAEFRDRPGIKKVIFVDNTLTLNPSRIEELCDHMERLRATTDFVWACESHVHFLNQHASAVSRMVAAGLVKLQIGIETGSAKILRAYRKNITPAQIIDAVVAARDAGLPFLKTNFIIGGPHETWASIDESLALAKALVDIAPGRIEISSNYLAPYPCTDIARDPASVGLRILDEQSLTCFESMTYPVVETATLSKKDLIRARRYFDDALLSHMRERAASLAYPAIAKIFQYYYRYHLNSPWVDVFRENREVAAFFERVSLDGARPSYEFCSEALVDLRPVRTIDLEEVDEDEMGPSYHGARLDPIELTFLEYATGKLSNRDIWAVLRSKDLVAGESTDDFRLQEMLGKFIQRFWLAFVEW